MMRKRLHILGAGGMLAQMVHRYFAHCPEWDVAVSFIRFDHQNLIDHFRHHDDEAPAVFINCIGAIPQKTPRAEHFVLPNLLLPLELARGLSPKHLLVHPSTNGVFSGRLGQPYPSDMPPDPIEPYGWSKVQAERVLAARANTLIVRTSIIGPDDALHAKGLLQWFMSQPREARVQGYTNHFWNGVTTLQWCTEIERLLQPSQGVARLVHIGTTQSYSKHQMLCLFRDRFRPDIDVEAVQDSHPVDLRLQPDLVAPPLLDQLYNLSKFMRVQ